MTTGKSFANGNGESFGQGPILPLWLRHDWEFAEVWATRSSNWTVQA